MEKDDVKKLLMTMEVTFPNFKIVPEQLGFTLNAWYEALKDFSSEDIAIAYQTYLNTISSPFAPSVSQLIGLVHTPREMANMDVSEAWAKVRNAISRGAYNSKEEFLKLPPLVQRAVGSAEQIHLWAIDENYNNEVVMALFQKNYKAIVERNNVEQRLPAEAREKLEQIRRDNIKLLDSNTYLIGQQSDKLQEGDFDYDEPQRAENETLGHYAQQLREKWGM